MRKTATFVAAAGAVAMLMGTASIVAPGVAHAEDLVAKGKKVAENRKKGNCVACHQYQGAVSPGNMGPPLVAMKARFPNKADLRAQIHDPTAKNPNTVMPPFGKYEILSKDDIDAITEWVHTL